MLEATACLQQDVRSTVNVFHAAGELAYKDTSNDRATLGQNTLEALVLPEQGTPSLGRCGCAERAGNDSR